MEEYAQEPCPWRIVDDCGGAFTMGVISGGVFQAIKGFRNAPVGMRHRLRGSVNAVRIRAPQIGGSLAVWGGLFSTIDRGLVRLRGKEDPWNFHHQWSIDQGCAGCPQWTIGHGGLRNDGGHPIGPHRGYWHPSHLLYRAAVPQCTPFPGEPWPAAL